jgi:hypothetical protein
MRNGRRDEKKRITTANSVDEEIKHTMEMEARRKQGLNDQNYSEKEMRKVEETKTRECCVQYRSDGAVRCGAEQCGAVRCGAAIEQILDALSRRGIGNDISASRISRTSRSDAMR